MFFELGDLEFVLPLDIFDLDRVVGCGHFELLKSGGKMFKFTVSGFNRLKRDL